MYPPHHLGGYELSCRDVVERWRARGHEVRVLTSTMRVPGIADEPLEAASGVDRKLHLHWDDVMVAPPRHRRASIERGNQAVLRSVLTDHTYDVVSVWHMGAMSMGLLTTIAERGIPMVFVICDDWLLYGPDVDPWIRMFLRRPRLGRITRLLTGLPTRLPNLGPDTPFCFNSDWVRRRALERSRFPVQTSTVVYTGIDPTDFPIDASPRPPWRWRLVCVGRQEPRKGTHVAIRALARLPNEARLDVIGPGDDNYLDELRRLASSLDLESRVAFRQRDRAELKDEYKAADVFVFPVTWDEPFGLVPVEAMACGVPVIATGTGGSAEFLIHEVNCLLVAKDDDDAIANAVSRLASDAQLRERLVAGGRATAEEMNVDRLADALEQWHRAAADRFAHGTPSDLPPPGAALRTQHRG